MNIINKNIAVADSNQLKDFLSAAGEYKWIVLASPIIICLGGKVCSLVQTAMENGYEVKAAFSQEGKFEFSMKPHDSDK